MAITSTQQTEILKVVAGLFNAAPGGSNLSSLAAFIEGGNSIRQLADALAAHSLFTNDVMAGKVTTEAQVAVLMNNFGLVADSDPASAGSQAQTYFTNQINGGAGFGEIVYNAVTYLSGSPAPEFATAATLLANKAAVAAAYSAIKSSSNLSELQNVLSTVTGTAVYTAADIQAILDGTATGDLHTLTTSADNVVGGAGVDVINGYVNVGTPASSTLSGADSINGGGGSDTLNVTVENGGGGIPGASISSVENFYVRDIGAGGTTDFGAIAGEEVVVSDRSTAAVTFNNLGTGTQVGVKGDGGSGSLGALAFTMATATDALNVVIDNSGASNTGNITNNNSGATAATITSKGGTNKVGTVDLDTAALLTSLTVNATTSLTATLGADYAATAALTVAGAASSVDLGTATNFKTIDASGLTAGGLTIAVGTNTTSFKGGAGNDAVTTAAVATTTASTIDAGTGTGDRLVVGTGTDVDTAAEAKVYSGFDILEVGNGLTVDAALFTNSSITSLRTSGTATINNVTAAQAGAITVNGDAATTLTVDGATTVGQLDTVTLNAKFDSATAEAADGDATLTLTAPSLAGVETVNVKAGLDASLTGIAITAMTGTLALTNLNLSGTAKTWSVTSGAAAQNVNTVIDASAVTTAATIDYSAATGNGVSIKGGSAADTLKGGILTDSITGGAGNDTITADLQAAGQANVVTGGAGGDLYAITAGENTTFKFSGTDSVTKDGVTAGYHADSMDTIGSGTLPVVAANWADGTAGFKATIDTDVAATAVTFSTTAVTFGTTTVTNAGDFYVYDTAAGGELYVYQDSNSNSKIDAGDFGVKVVGATSAFTSGEFAITSGNLVFTSIV